jgi:hypothetical protein
MHRSSSPATLVDIFRVLKYRGALGGALKLYAGRDPRVCCTRKSNDTSGRLRWVYRTAPDTTTTTAAMAPQRVRELSLLPPPAT